jgi:RNA polymerase subunit RPABC4/transcription elongation factor Spt4
MASPKCKQCGTVITPGQTVCEVCGAAIDPADTAPTAVPAPAPAVTPAAAVNNKCKFCGAVIPSGETVCPACGVANDATAQDGTTQNTKAQNTAANDAADPAGQPQAADTLNNIGDSIGKAFDKGADSVIRGGKAAAERLKDPEQRKKMLPVLVGIVGAIVIIVLVIVLVNVLAPKPFTALTNPISISSQGNDEIVIAFPNGNKAEFDGNLMDAQYSADQTKMALLIEEEAFTGDYEDFPGYALYLVGESTTLVKKSGVYGMRFSADGSAVAYWTDYESEEAKRDIILWKNGKETAVADDIYCQEFVVSPDGTAVFYTVLNRDDDDNSPTAEGYLYAGGKTAEIDKKIEPFAVSNGGKYIYYRRGEASYVQTGDDPDSRHRLGDNNIYGFYFNEDHTEFIYENDSRSYIIVDGGEKIELEGTVNELLLPQNTAFHQYTWCVKTFAGVLYQNTYYEVARINNRFESEIIAQYAVNPAVTDDNKTLFFLYGGTIRKTDATRSGAKQIDVSGSDIESFVMTPNGSAVWFINSDDELYYKKGSSKGVRVNSDIPNSGYERFWTLYKGKTLYYISDYELYVTTDGKKGTRITGFDGDVGSVTSAGDTITVYLKNETEFYYQSTDGKRFEILENNSEL